MFSVLIVTVLLHYVNRLLLSNLKKVDIYKTKQIVLSIFTNQVYKMHILIFRNSYDIVK